MGGEVTVRAQRRLDQFRGCTLLTHCVPLAEVPDTPKHVLDVQVSVLDVGRHVTGRRVTAINMDQLVVATRGERGDVFGGGWRVCVWWGAGGGREGEEVDDGRTVVGEEHGCR